MSILDRLLAPIGHSAREHRLDNRERHEELRAANRAQSLQLLSQAPPKDIEDLIPILTARVRETTLAHQRALDELADALLVSEANREVRRAD